MERPDASDSDSDRDSDGDIIVSSDGSVIELSGDSDSGDSGIDDMPLAARLPLARAVGPSANPKPSSPGPPASGPAASATKAKATTKEAVTALFEDLRAAFAERPRFANKRQRLLDCKILFETSTARHGCYRPKTNTVYINQLNLAKGIAFIEETLRHELAHLISPPVRKANGKWDIHGPAWRAVALQLGCKHVGKRRASSPVREAKQRRAKYFITCGCPGRKRFVSTDRGIAKYRKTKPRVCIKCRAACKDFPNNTP